MQTVFLVMHFLICASLILLVLVQQGRGADAGVNFGSGNASSVFGAAGSTSFLVKLTTFFAALFFMSTLLLGIVESKGAYDSVRDVISDEF